MIFFIMIRARINIQKSLVCSFSALLIRSGSILCLNNKNVFSSFHGDWDLPQVKKRKRGMFMFPSVGSLFMTLKVIVRNETFE